MKIFRLVMAIGVAIALTAAAGLAVSTQGFSGDGEGKAPVTAKHDISSLPERVADMRQRLLEAARTGDIEALRPVLESNELMPIFSFGGATDPIAYWKSISADGKGRDILAILIEVLESGFVRMDAGTPKELFVWPYFYALDLAKLTPAQEVELYKLVTPKDLKMMKEAGSYLHYRAGIGPDGTLHFFVAGD